MKKIILTFDYEIYFDGGNQYHQLIENTSRLVHIADSSQAKLVFFIDILYLVKLEETGQMEALNLLRGQAKAISDNGHEVQFHYHPHWIHAKYSNESNTWIFDKTEYSFSDIVEKYGLEQARNWFNFAISRFNEYFPHSSSTFRAGGLSINGNEVELISLLIENRFKYDSSVMPGLKIKGKHLSNNHTVWPGKDKWFINAEGGFFKESRSETYRLMEIPIMTIRKEEISLTKRVATSLKYRLGKMIAGKPANSAKPSGKPIDLGIIESFYPITTTFDKSNWQDIILLKYYTREYLKGENNFMCIMSHPKSYRDQSYKVFEQYLKWIGDNQEKISIAGFNDLN